MDDVMKTPGVEFPVFKEEVDLPSKGRFYPKDHVLRDRESIEIFYPSTKEQDILTDKKLLMKNIALDEMLKSIIIDKNIVMVYDSLLSCDRSALSVSARALMHGNMYEAKATCGSCGHKQHVGVDLTTIDPYYAELTAERLEELGIEVCEEVAGTVFRTELPMTKTKVGFHLLTVRDEKKINDLSEKKRKLRLQQTPIADQMSKFVVEVNGHKGVDYIRSFVERVPALDANHLYKLYREVAPDFKLLVDFECENCGAMEPGREVLPDVNFFWPN